MKRRGGSGAGGHGAAGGASSRRDGGGHRRDDHGRDGEGKLRIHLKRSCTDKKLVPQGNTELGLTTDGEGYVALGGYVAAQGLRCVLHFRRASGGVATGEISSVLRPALLLCMGVLCACFTVATKHPLGMREDWMA